MSEGDHGIVPTKFAVAIPSTLPNGHPSANISSGRGWWGVWWGYDVASIGGGEFALRLVPRQRAAPFYRRTRPHTHTHTLSSPFTRPYLLCVCTLLNCWLTGNFYSNAISHEVILLGRGTMLKGLKFVMGWMFWKCWLAPCHFSCRHRRGHLKLCPFPLGTIDYKSLFQGTWKALPAFELLQSLLRIGFDFPQVHLSWISWANLLQLCYQSLIRHSLGISVVQLGYQPKEVQLLWGAPVSLSRLWIWCPLGGTSTMQILCDCIHQVLLGKHMICRCGWVDRRRCCSSWCRRLPFLRTPALAENLLRICHPLLGGRMEISKATHKIVDKRDCHS